MSIRIIGKQIEITSSLDKFITSEIEKSVKQHRNGNIDAVVTIMNNTQHNDVHTDIQIQVGDEFLTHCIGRGHDAHKSAGMALEKLEEQLRHPKTHLVDEKSKMSDHEHHDGFRGSYPDRPGKH